MTTDPITISMTATRSIMRNSVSYMLARFRSLALTMIACTLLICGAACDSVERTTAVPEDQFNQVYWSLRLNHHAITLSTTAPWNTMQLAVTPLTYEGQALPIEGGTVSYVSLDTNAVKVAPDGTVRALEATGIGTVQVVAQLTLGTITHADTALIKVMSNPAPKTLQSFSLRPGPDDSAKIDQNDAFGMGLDLSRFLDRPDQNGDQMTELLVYYRSLDEHVAKVDRTTGVLLDYFSNNPRKIGDARVIATVYAYGVSFTDTLVVTIGHPLYVLVNFDERQRLNGQGMEIYLPEGGNRIIGVGGLVVITNLAYQPVELRFEDATGVVQDPYGFGSCAIGPLPDLLFPPVPPDDSDPMTNEFPCTEYLMFNQPGTYRYREVQSGLSGVITVVDERRPTP